MRQTNYVSREHLCDGGRGGGGRGGGGKQARASDKIKSEIMLLIKRVLEMHSPSLLVTRDARLWRKKNGSA